MIPPTPEGLGHNSIITGLSGGNLTVGSFLLDGNAEFLAGYYRLGDATPQFIIPNITTLGATSTATGVNDHDLIVGNTAGTVFLYNVAGEQLIDLNAQNFQGADVLRPGPLQEIYGITDADIFFGKYTALDGETRYFRAAFQDVFPELTPGDFDQDGDVDGRDFLLWQRSQHRRSRRLAGVLWEGAVAGAVSGSTTRSVVLRAVPEPGSLIVLCAGVVLMGLVPARLRCAAPRG